MTVDIRYDLPCQTALLFADAFRLFKRAAHLIQKQQHTSFRHVLAQLLPGSIACLQSSKQLCHPFPVSPSVREPSGVLFCRKPVDLFQKSTDSFLLRCAGGIDPEHVPVVHLLPFKDRTVQLSRRYDKHIPAGQLITFVLNIICHTAFHKKVDLIKIMTVKIDRLCVTVLVMRNAKPFLSLHARSPVFPPDYPFPLIIPAFLLSLWQFLKCFNAIMAIYDI